MQTNDHIPGRRRRAVEEEELSRTEQLRRRAVQESRDRFDRTYGVREPVPTAARSDTRSAYRQRPRKKHTFLWTMLFLVSLSGLVAAGLLVLPMLTGLRLPGLPAAAFVNGEILAYDETGRQAMLADRSLLDAGVFYPGIRIDGVDIGGMTWVQARAAVEKAAPTGGGDLAVTLIINGTEHRIDAGNVPMWRNTEEILALGWSYGRRNSAPVGSTVFVPLEERAR